MSRVITQAELGDHAALELNISAESLWRRNEPARIDQGAVSGVTRDAQEEIRGLNRSPDGFSHALTSSGTEIVPSTPSRRAPLRSSSVRSFAIRSLDGTKICPLR